MKQITLEYLPQFKAFGISDEAIAECEKNQIIPELVLAPRTNTDEPQMTGNYKLLHVTEPRPDAVTIGFLMGREKDYYAVDWNYARALAKTGAYIRFITYEHPITQFQGCAGLVLPGGSFVSPEEYYTDPQEHKELSPRANAYVKLIEHARAQNIPMLGVCAGAQMIGAAFGLKMYRDQSHISGEINHKSKELYAHKVIIHRDNPLCRMFHNIPETWVNSRHNESIVPDTGQSELHIYATSTDGVPEAWGSEEKGVLCVQWHPEDEATLGGKAMQSIYNWIVEQAVACQK